MWSKQKAACVAFCLVIAVHVFVQCVIIGASPGVYVHMALELSPLTADRLDHSVACAKLNAWKPHGVPTRHAEWRQVEIKFCAIPDFTRIFQANNMSIGLVDGLYAHNVSTVIIYSEPVCGDLIETSPDAVVVDISDWETVVSAPGQRVAVKTLVLSCANSSNILSIPLPPKTLAHYQEPEEPRQYLATFAGSIYLTKRGAAERQAVVSLHNPDAGIIAVGFCHTGQQAYKMIHNLAYCDKLQRTFYSYTQQELRNTTFGLVPVGRSPATFRLAETLLNGQIPVIIAPDDFCLPFSDVVPWERISLRFTSGKERLITDVLRQILPITIRDMLYAAKPYLYRFMLGHIVQTALAANGAELRIQ